MRGDDLANIGSAFVGAGLQGMAGCFILILVTVVVLALCVAVLMAKLLGFF